MSQQQTAPTRQEQEATWTARPPIGLRPGRLRNFKGEWPVGWCPRTMAIQYPSLVEALLAIVALNESSPYDFEVEFICQHNQPGHNPDPTLGWVGRFDYGRIVLPVSVDFKVNIPDRDIFGLGDELFEAAAGGWWHST